MLIEWEVSVVDVAGDLGGESVAESERNDEEFVPECCVISTELQRADEGIEGCGSRAQEGAADPEGIFQ